MIGFPPRRAGAFEESTTVRVIVRDEGSGHLGEMDVPLNLF